MEARMKKYREEVSPERAKVWTEKSPKYHQKIKKVQIVYYLSKNRQLEHPHFMEVLVSSPNGLYLRDVIERLNVLRGRGMASMYSWSSKRSYRNGFVWHDLSEDDLILPAHGNEYVLKGSELFDEDHFSPIANSATQNMKQIVVEPPSSRSMDDSSSSSSMNNGKETNKHSQEDDELSPPALRSVSSSGVSPDSRDAKNSSSWCLAEYKVYNREGLADASTQTDETVTGCSKTPVETFSRGVSTDDDGSSEPESSENNASCSAGKERESESAEISRNSVSPPFSNSASSLGAKTDTLESLIRADVSKMNSFRILEQEDVRMPANPRLRASNMLMQLISCGSISVKDNSFGLVPTYKPKFGHSKFPSPFFSSSFMLGDLDRLSETPSVMSLRLEEKEYFSGSLVETKLQKKDAADGNASLKRSSSYNGDRASNQMGIPETVDSKPGGSKHIPRTRKTSCTISKKQPRSESTRSPVSDSSKVTETPDVCSKRITESLRKPDSFREDEEKVIKIDERLASGARVIIESKVPSSCS
ncbi:unnamed protein product [Thlaspi arvense]|uniref:SOSEKI DIX-like domain-containing protein n=1 Tax=Thlaspi arvense TaxID=13288 RepID=A0AAU9SDN0_THLAR|nr:unnamed protein product [Thlaspi arvense]